MEWDYLAEYQKTSHYQQGYIGFNMPLSVEIYRLDQSVWEVLLFKTIDNSSLIGGSRLPFDPRQDNRFAGESWLDLEFQDEVIMVYQIEDLYAILNSCTRILKLAEYW